MRAALLLGFALSLPAQVASADKTQDQAKQVIQRWKRVRTSDQRGYREVIPDELSTKFRVEKLARKDKPLAAGDRLPAVAGLPSGRPLAILFFRGHW